jgi:predicted dehydrogenase
MLRVAIVGCGFMGRMHASVYGLLDRARLVAVVDDSSERRAEYATSFGAAGYGTLEEALAKEEIDAVDICLPTDLHCDYTLRVAKAGKHVFCEKPMALTVEDADRMIEASTRAGIRLMIGHCIRFWPEYAFLKKLADDGAMGKLLSVNLTRYGEFPSWSAGNWLGEEKRSGGAALDMHIHDTDFARYLFGEPDEMASFGTDDGRGVGQIFTTMRFGNAIVHAEGGWNLPKKTPFKMSFRAVFERGVAFMDGGPMTIIEQGKEPETPKFAAMKVAGGGNISDLGGYFVELDYFVNCVLDGKPFEISTPESSRDSLRTVLEEISQAKSKLGR